MNSFHAKKRCLLQLDLRLGRVKLTPKSQTVRWKIVSFEKMRAKAEPLSEHIK